MGEKEEPSFRAPEKKKPGVAVARVSLNNSKKSVKLTIPFAKYVHFKGNVLRILIPDDASVKDAIINLDKDALVAAVANNETWFKNALTSEQIQEFFRASLNNNMMALLVSDVKTPLLYYNQKLTTDSIDSLKEKEVDWEWAKCRLSAEIDIQGLYFFRQKFGLRWILRVLRVDDVDTDTEPLVQEQSKQEIEATWTEDLLELDGAIDADIAKIRSQIDQLSALKEDAKRMIARAREAESCSEDWEATLSELSRKIAKYYNGSLFYL